MSILMKLVMVVVMVSSMAMMLCTCQARTDICHPVILVPGSGGNQLEAKLSRDYYKTSSLACRFLTPAHRWFRLWFDLKVLVQPFTECFAERMTLHYDPVKDDYRNARGVETRVPYFGSTEGLQYLNPNPILKDITAYMAPLVESLERQGYVEGQDLFGAPYSCWRGSSFSCWH
ncbi:hypothetical protein C5167_009969 [Papaver somniferum]|uniref:Uncharacterized protein n=1 Tax=Papaver somniferum TaxID=3469 RepID=A0A4Y7K2U4_PAPSO|nr:hypothetical protein C5167_009969 [Papaver somniferum]